MAASQPYCREESASTDLETGGAANWQEVHHGVPHHCEWLEQETHRALKNQAQTKLLFVDASTMDALVLNFHV
jgi:hypothetical protein